MRGVRARDCVRIRTLRYMTLYITGDFQYYLCLLMSNVDPKGSPYCRVWNLWGLRPARGAGSLASSDYGCMVERLEQKTTAPALSDDTQAPAEGLVQSIFYKLKL